MPSYLYADLAPCSVKPNTPESGVAKNGLFAAPMRYFRAMFVVTPSTMLNRAALETRQVPKRMLGRIAVLPRAGASGRIWLRLIFEMQLLRFLIPLIPFVLAMVIWPHLALPISQAPVPMMLAIGFVEMRVLAISPEARKRLISEDAVARGLDALRFNARGVLTRIAARREMQVGELSLVIEQSELARVPPLTLVSVQRAAPEPEVLDLSSADRALIEAGLFDDDLTAARLHQISLATKENLHMVTLDTAAISAHARMAALMDTAAPPQGVAT